MKHKYGARSTIYNGERYPSKAEASYAMQLDALRSAIPITERVVNVERQPAFTLAVNGSKVCRYIADFRVTYADGHVTVFEVKGFPTPVWKLKYKLFLALFPDVRLEVVK